MESLSLIKGLFGFDRWANQRTLEAIRNAGITQTTDPAFHLLSHVAQAQKVWLARCTGSVEPDVHWVASGIDELTGALEDANQRWQDYLALLNAVDLSEQVAYETSDEKPFEATLSDICLHLIIHGQHHRAQVSAILSSAGHRPPEIDYIAFVRIAP